MSKTPLAEGSMKGFYEYCKEVVRCKVTKTQKYLDEGWIKQQPISEEFKEFLETYTEWTEEDVICDAIRNELPHLKCGIRTKGFDINVMVSDNIVGSELKSVAKIIRNHRSVGVGTLGDIEVGFIGHTECYWTTSFDVGRFDE